MDHDRHSLIVVRQQRKTPKPNLDTGDIMDAKKFFGLNMDLLKHIKAASLIGHLKMNIVRPPEGTIWGHFNDRAVNWSWVSGLVNDFPERLNNCDDKFVMEMAVKRFWVLNIADAEDNRILSGKNITELPKLQLTEEGLHNILTEDLWVMGGNHRRLALIEYNTQLNERIEILEADLLAQNIATGISADDTDDTDETSTANAAAAGSGPPYASTSASTSARMSARTSKDVSTETLRAHLRQQICNLRAKIKQQEPTMWTMALYDRGTPIITFRSVYIPR